MPFGSLTLNPSATAAQSRSSPTAWTGKSTETPALSCANAAAFGRPNKKVAAMAKTADFCISTFADIGFPLGQVKFLDQKNADAQREGHYHRRR